MNSFQMDVAFGHTQTSQKHTSVFCSIYDQSVFSIGHGQPKRKHRHPE